MKVLFFLFAVGTCQVTWKGKSGKWEVIFRLFSGTIQGPSQGQRGPRFFSSLVCGPPRSAFSIFI